VKPYHFIVLQPLLEAMPYNGQFWQENFGDEKAKLHLAKETDKFKPSSSDATSNW